MPINHIESGVLPLRTGRIVSREFNDDDVVLASNSKSQLVTPPPGHKWTLIGLYLFAPEVILTTSGDHSFSVQIGDVNLIKGVGLFNSDILWDHSHWEDVDSHLPLDDVASLTSLLNSEFSNEYPLNILYHNGTDAATQPARYRIGKITAVEQSIY